MAIISTIAKATIPATAHATLSICFTTASITMITRKSVATSFHPRNCCEEYLNTPLSCCFKIACSDRWYKNKPTTKQSFTKSHVGKLPSKYQRDPPKINVRIADGHVMIYQSLLCIMPNCFNRIALSGSDFKFASAL